MQPYSWPQRTFPRQTEPRPEPRAPRRRRAPESRRSAAPEEQCERWTSSLPPYPSLPPYRTGPDLNTGFDSPYFPKLRQLPATFKNSYQTNPATQPHCRGCWLLVSLLLKIPFYTMQGTVVQSVLQGDWPLGTHTAPILVPLWDEQADSCSPPR